MKRPKEYRMPISRSLARALRSSYPRYERINETTAKARARLTGAAVNFVPPEQTMMRRAYPNGKVITKPNQVTP